MAPLCETPAAPPLLALDFGDGDAYAQLKVLLAQRGFLSNGEAQAALGVDGDVARRLPSAWWTRGWREVEGQKRGTRYVWRRGP